MRTQRFCPRTLLIAQRLINYFQKNGWRLSDERNSDVVLLFGCAFSDEEESFALKQLEYLKEASSGGQKVIMMGCLPSVKPGLIQEEATVLSIGYEELDRLDRIINARVQLASVPFPNVLDEKVYESNSYRSRWSGTKFLVELFRKDRLGKLKEWPTARLCYRFLSFRPDAISSKYYLLLSTGCLSECSYCSERFFFTRHTSRSEEQILSDFVRGQEEGYKTFVLEAFDTATYGFDLGRTGIVQLLEKLEANKKNLETKMEILNFNPRYLVEFFPDFMAILHKSTMIDLIQIPIQSGSDEVLELMNRRYRAGDVKRCVQQINSEYPGIRLDTHFIVGHPGETAEDHQKSIQMIRDTRFTKITAFRYERRNGTVSGAMENQVAVQLINKRYLEMWRYILVDHFRKTWNPGATLVDVSAG